METSHDKSTMAETELKPIQIADSMPNMPRIHSIVSTDEMASLNTQPIFRTSPYLALSIVDGEETFLPCYMPLADHIKSLGVDGSYTVLSTHQRRAVFQLGMHGQRLSHTFQVMMDGRPAETDAQLTFMSQETACAWLESVLPRVINAYESSANPPVESDERTPCQYRIAIHIAVPTAAVSIHIGPMHIACEECSSVEIDVRPGQREYSDAKNSRWLLDRTRYTPAHTGINETVLFDEATGVITEGLSSNFFVIKDRKVLTAVGGVVEGTVRAILLETAQELGYEIVPEVNVADLTPDAAVVITSTSRYVLPVSAAHILGTNASVVHFNVQACRELQGATISAMGRSCTVLQGLSIKGGKEHVWSSSPILNILEKAGDSV
ncbi:Aminotransferase, class IV [Carpediemonas membranifera]|uniref:Aminotransferase, class IV n=1 Tax=Carpediemonas membranifera TaxID=201153 RepID=A0A8J6ASE8_9EUKA|nr:Aminotransferase, class IV [Carpediemonas membranifera]|eukprot:KAG9392863.1 Aminotransferase, class IV [Carpediemonas membranifera]